MIRMRAVFTGELRGTIPAMSICILFIGGLGGAARAAEQALMADRAVDIMGVNTHVWYQNWDSRIKPALLESGIRHVRDWAGAEMAGRYRNMAANGVDFTLINFKSEDLGAVKALNASAPKPVLMVEPTNEVDCNWKAGWQDRMRNEQIGLFNRYKADPGVRDILVAGPSFCNSKDSPGQFAQAFPASRDFMDASNLHNYTGGNPIEGPLGGGWGVTFENTVQFYQKVSGTKLLVSTETGYHNSIRGGMVGHAGVSERAAAKYLPRLFLAHLQRGFKYVFLYEFYDQGTNPLDMEENFGLLRNDYSRKPQFTSLKNYAGILSDRGASFTPAALDFAIAGELDNVRHMVFQKRDGRFYIVLWQAVDSYDFATRKDLEPAPKNVTLTLQGKATTAKVFLPLQSAEARQTLSGSVLNIQVPDHLVIVELSGISGSPIRSDFRFGKPAFRADMPGGGVAERPVWQVNGARLRTLSGRSWTLGFP